MVSKKNKSLTVKFKGTKPSGNVVLAKINNGITGSKISFPHRYCVKVETNLDVEVPEGYRLCFRLCQNLCEKGMVATNAPGHLKSGKLYINLLNSGREIFELKDSDELAFVWLELDQEFIWEE